MPVYLSLLNEDLFGIIPIPYFPSDMNFSTLFAQSYKISSDVPDADLPFHVSTPSHFPEELRPLFCDKWNVGEVRI